ncbi:hypothetical protein R3W88_004893 [Solanum pinnatisectum]|uniref:TF-B3 domain-containing protein n=1 Tax=Solanum pinnatisectum TaxID=50273 RepID=A0AAV9KAJ7_9SOLN|nr:hypothetical protein R3W88_004893 [Solanum pinnatisectum]
MAVDPNNKHPSFSNLLEQGFIDRILELGDMLIFYLVEKSTFHVLHYSKKPRINILHYEELSSSEDEVENVEEKDDEEENIEASRKYKRVKTEPKESSAIDDEGCKMQSQQSSVIYDVRRTVMDREKAIAYQRAKANFKSKNSFFISFMHHSYISRSSNHLCIKLRFARTYIPENCSNIMLRVAGRGYWPVTDYKGPTQAKIDIGWGAFVLDNQLKLGDVCVFEVIKGTQIFMDVTIFCTAGSTPMQETDRPDCS